MEQHKQSQHSEPIIITDSELCKSVYYPDRQIIRSVYNGVASHARNRQLFYEHLENALQFAKSHPVKGVIIDLRKIVGSFIQVMQRLDEEYYPAMKQYSGFTHQAIVVPDDLIIKHLSMKLLDLLAHQQVTGKIFYDYNEAEKWLLQQIATGEEE